jgi:hypothetical protein
MKQLLPFLICLALIDPAGSASAEKNYMAAWTLHYAGEHQTGANTCSFQVTDCVIQLDVDAPSLPGRYDVYVIATNMDGIAHSRFGIECDGSFFFYGWMSCADSETGSGGWPGCGEGVTLTWASEQLPGHLTIGILDGYSYGGPSFVCASADPRVGYGEWCDGTTPTPLCNQATEAWRFGCVGFGAPGYLNCPPPLHVDESTWGGVKALYRE